MNVLPSWQAAEDLANDLPNLSKEEQQRMVPRILFILKNIHTMAPIAWDSFDFEDEVLTPLMPYIPVEEVINIWKIAETYGKRTFYTRNLAIIAPYLPEKDGKEIIYRLLKKKKSLEFDDKANSLLLLELAKRSVGDEQTQYYFDAWNQALSSVSTYQCGKQGVIIDQEWLNNFASNIPSDIIKIIWIKSIEYLRTPLLEPLRDCKNGQIYYFSLVSLSLKIPIDYAKQAIDDCNDSDYRKKEEVITILETRLSSHKE
jgi:hypothetical protein